MKNLSNSRITLGSFDFIKGIAIVYVIIFHILPRYIGSMEEGSAFWSTVMSAPLLVRHVLLLFMGYYFSSGLMPLFLIISGYIFKPTSIKKMLKKTAHSLLIPYVLVAMSYAVIAPILINTIYDSWRESLLFGLKYFVAFLFGFGAYGKVVFGLETMWNTATWFLLASFVAQNLLNLICKIKRERIQYFIIVICVCVGFYLQSVEFGFFCIPQALLCVGYIYFGYQLKKKKLLLKMMNQISIYGILTAFWFAQIVWGKFDIFSGAYNYWLFDYIAAGATGLLFMMVGLRLGEKEWKVFDVVKQAGMYSYWILPIHAAEMEVIPWWYWINLPLEDKLVLGLIVELTCKVIIIVVVCWMIKFIQKYNYTRRMRLQK